MAGIAVGHSGAYKGPGTYKGAGPANKGIKAIGHSFAYRGPGTYAKPGAPHASHPAPHAPNPMNNPLLNPNTPLAGKSLQQAAQALTDSQTKGPLAELAAQLARNNNQGNAAEKLTSGYFNQLGNQVQSGVNQERQFGNALNSQLQNIGNQTQNYLGQLGSVNTQSMLQHAPQGEGGTNPAIQGLTAELARQQGLAAQDAGSARLSGAAQGNNYGQLAASNLATYGLRGQERLGNIAQATRLSNEPINQKIANISAQRGSLLATNEGKLRQQEITNRVTQEGLGIKKDANAITRQNDLANQGIKNRAISSANARNAANIQAANGRNAANIDAANARNAANLAQSNTNNLRTTQTSASNAALSHASKIAKSGKGALTQNEQNTLYGQVDRIMALIADGQRHGLSEAQIRQNLESGSNPAKAHYPASLIQAGYEQKGWGHITPTTARILYGMGLRGPHFKVAPAPRGVLGGSLFGIPI